MAKILNSDIIFATVIQRGSTVASLRMSGISSLTDIICRVREVIGEATGLTTINLRNGSQGWNHRHTVMFA
ncbi:MAG: hypothetical protein NC043_06875 [Muribaculaceae bacterium]|nr:hypothetical protein [Muribaculaceae bacterium]